MTVARSAQIAAELRHHISSGELRPGEPLPSTRALVRRYGVAMATATKALTTLRQEGVIRSVPGVGTVVAQEEPSPTSQSAPLAPRRSGSDGFAIGRIVDTGIAIADAEGLAALSMRRVAAELNVGTMSLYRHIRDKDDLLLQMMNAAITEFGLPQHPPPDWRAAVELAAHLMWATFRRHPWLAPAMSLTRPQPLEGALTYTEWVLAALQGLGLDPVATFTAHLTLLNFVRGTAMNLELEAEAEASSGQSNQDWKAQTAPDFLALMAIGPFPVLQRTLDSGFHLNLDALFEFGLQRLADGFALLASRS